MRGFEKVSYISKGVIPTRGSKNSAGYDFSTIEEIIIDKGDTIIVPTGIKAFMQEDEVLELYVRSSIGLKKKLMLANTVGIIDSDYYNNIDNEGHIMIALYNYGNEKVIIEKNERIAQGIFKKYFTTTNDTSNTQRNGGFGSTDKK